VARGFVRVVPVLPEAPAPPRIVGEAIPGAAIIDGAAVDLNDPLVQQALQESGEAPPDADTPALDAVEDESTSGARRRTHRTRGGN
jgi:hypothetical protein